MTYRRGGASGDQPPVLLEAVPVQVTYSVVDEAAPAEAYHPAGPRRRHGLVQFGLEFARAAFGAVLRLTQSLVGILMPLGIAAACVFLAIHFLTDIGNALLYAGVAGGLAAVSFTYCYLTGLLQARIDRFVDRDA